MEGDRAQERVRIRANSPGEYPILVVELPSGGLRAVYFETGYDLGRAKTVEEDWLLENAVGRHSFVEVDPPVEMPAGSL
jgi:hypothetical protein